MGTIDEIKALEEQLRLAELGPDPKFFEEALDDEAVLDGRRVKAKVIAAHQPDRAPKFTKVEMSEMQIVDHGEAAVVTCKGTYEGLEWSGTLKFTRVWMKKDGRWRIIAGSVAQG